MIGAGSVVTNDIPDYALAYGVPANVRGYVCECSQDLIFKDLMAQCQCGKLYQDEKDGVVRIK
jgi:UDP-2-acetamido-3-amino-2,3-dideoxy-glucuronate N-acetyltransferase